MQVFESLKLGLPLCPEDQIYLDMMCGKPHLLRHVLQLFLLSQIRGLLKAVNDLHLGPMVIIGFHMIEDVEDKLVHPYQVNQSS